MTSARYSAHRQLSADPSGQRRPAVLRKPLGTLFFSFLACTAISSALLSESTNFYRFLLSFCFSSKIWDNNIGVRRKQWSASSKSLSSSTRSLWYSVPRKFILTNSYMHHRVVLNEKFFPSKLNLRPYYKKSQNFQLKNYQWYWNTTETLNKMSPATTFAKESGADILVFWTNCSKYFSLHFASDFVPGLYEEFHFEKHFALAWLEHFALLETVPRNKIHELCRCKCACTTLSSSLAAC